jgi:hypothetical protein
MVAITYTTTIAPIPEANNPKGGPDEGAHRE